MVVPSETVTYGHSLRVGIQDVEFLEKRYWLHVVCDMLVDDQR